jgi:flagellar basal-body rod protein FlgF
MSRDIYAGLAGATATWVQMDVAANNLANASTTGFRAGRVAFTLEGQDGTGTLGKSYAGSTRTFLAETDGSINVDHDPLHFALSGEGYFVVQGAGEQLLTRDGRFTLNEDGRLVTMDGLPVLGEGGPIELAPGEAISVASDGTITGSISGQLDVMRIVTAPVESNGSNKLRPTGPLQPVTGTVQQGALEASNVNAMQVMVELIEAGRHFEAYQKAMQASDEADGRLNQLGGS